MKRQEQDQTSPHRLKSRSQLNASRSQEIVKSGLQIISRTRPQVKASVHYIGSPGKQASPSKSELQGLLRSLESEMSLLSQAHEAKCLKLTNENVSLKEYISGLEAQIKEGKEMSFRSHQTTEVQRLEQLIDTQAELMREYREKIRVASALENTLQSKVAELTSALLQHKTQAAKLNSKLSEAAHNLENKDLVISNLRGEVQNLNSLASPTMLMGTQTLFARDQLFTSQQLTFMNNTLKRAHGKSVEDLPRQLERTKSPSPQQQQLLKICQKMVNMSVKMECSHCSTTFLVTEFYDHLQSIDHESNSDTATKLKSRKRRTHAEGVKRSQDLSSHTRSAQALIYNHQKSQSKYDNPYANQHLTEEVNDSILYDSRLIMQSQDISSSKDAPTKIQKPKFDLTDKFVQNGIISRNEIRLQQSDRRSSEDSGNFSSQRELVYKQSVKKNNKTLFGGNSKHQSDYDCQTSQECAEDEKGDEAQVSEEESAKRFEIQPSAFKIQNNKYTRSQMEAQKLLF